MERRAFPSPLPLSQIRNFLLLEHSLALGTAIHATPLIAAIHAVLPDARVVAATSGFGLGILEGNPGLERLIAMPSPLADLPGAVQALHRMRPFAGEPFAVLQTTGNGRTRIAVGAALGGGHLRAGFTVHPELSAAPLAFDQRRSQIDNNLELLAALGHEAALRAALRADPQLREPRVYPAAADFDQVRSMLTAAGLATDAPLAVFITQTSPTQRKQWRAERFRRSAEVLAAEYGAQIVFGGTRAESEAIEALRAGLAPELQTRTANLAGQTTLLQMAALFGLADFALTLDTGPMHLGRAMGTPMVIVAPAWSPPLEWLPVGNPRVRILKNLDLPSAPEDYTIEEVSAEEAEAALRELLTLYPPRPRKPEPAQAAS